MMSEKPFVPGLTTVPFTRRRSGTPRPFGAVRSSLKRRVLYSYVQGYEGLDSYILERMGTPALIRRRTLQSLERKAHPLVLVQIRTTGKTVRTLRWKVGRIYHDQR